VLPTAATAAPGPVPYERFSEVNAKFRETEQRAKTLETQLQELSWAKGIDRNSLAETVRWRALAHTDAGKFLREVLAQAPDHVQTAFRSEYGRQLATKGNRDAEPQPDLQTETGQPVYSAPQLQQWHEWRDRQREAKFKTELDQRLAPYEQEAQQTRESRARVARQQHADTFAKTTFEQAKTWPGFLEHKAAIAKVYQETDGGAGSPAEERAALMEAYIRVVPPALRASAHADVLTDLKTRAVASSEHPSRTTSAAPTKSKTFGEALRASAAQLGGL
jgi:hypothetical protein